MAEVRGGRWIFTSSASEEDSGLPPDRPIFSNSEMNRGLTVFNVKNLTMGSLSELGNNQLCWLRRTLEATGSNWRIVVGFHPLAICEDGEDSMEAKQVFNSLRSTFTKFEVNAYLSRQGCTSSTELSSLSYIRNPGKMAAPSARLHRKLEDGFLLHRVSSLEIETYIVTSAGEVVHRSVLHHRGKEIM